MRNLNKVSIEHIEENYKAVYEQLVRQLSNVVGKTLAKCKEMSLSSSEIKTDKDFAQDLSDYLIAYWFFDEANALIEDIIYDDAVQGILSSNAEGWQVEYTYETYTNKGIGWWYEVSFKLTKGED